MEESDPLFLFHVAVYRDAAARYPSIAWRICVVAATFAAAITTAIALKGSGSFEQVSTWGFKDSFDEVADVCDLLLLSTIAGIQVEMRKNRWIEHETYKHLEAKKAKMGKAQ